MSTSGTLLFLGAVAAAGAMFATKPSNAEIEHKIAEKIYAEVQTTGASDLASGILLLTCKSNINECVQLLRSALTVRIEDKILWQNVRIGSGKNAQNCLGVLDQLYCPNFLNEDA